ncbi:MAG: hypothetical protein ACI85I_002931 [Arenicella sp.]|jgi:uncharacterized protein (TIGR02646 family)
MIRVKKSNQIPDKLRGKGVELTEEMKNLYQVNSADYDSDKSTFKIKSAVYGDKKVKAQLIAEQHGKCCFCEADFTANGYGDVEHFRPKGGFQQRKSDKIQKPGYYWLAYDWHNLFFSCQICNQRHKKNYFPLENPTERAKNHLGDISKERILLIHPSEDEPSDFISFRKEVPFPKNPKGKCSLLGFGIGREKLNDKRRGYLNKFHQNIVFFGLKEENIVDIVSTFSLTRENVEESISIAEKFIPKAFSDEAEFSGMIRANYPKLYQDYLSGLL